ncbi:MAG: hypothetical protein AB9866_17775 [Syntrophobacteraceae bacterium]
MKQRLCFLALIAAILLSVSPALADGDFYVIVGGGGPGTKITTLPLTISTPGFYYLGGNLNHTGDTAAITVNADDVTIDLMGFCLSGKGTNNGIFMSGRKNVEIRNGTLRNFARGVTEDSSSSVRHRIINVRVEGNGSHAAGSSGIDLSGNAHLVKGCTASGSRFGISINSGTVSGCKVEGCGFGINIDEAGNAIGNFVVCAATDFAGILGGNLMLDQNTVMGEDCSMRYDVFGGGAEWGTNVGD